MRTREPTAVARRGEPPGMAAGAVRAVPPAGASAEARANAAPSGASARPRARSPVLPISTRALGFEAGGKPLIEHLDLDLRTPGITMVMGPNGAGKSLLLRLLHGLVTPSAGAIRYAGEPLSDALRRRQAMVFQKPVLLRRSVAANIDFVLRARRDVARRSRAALLAHVGLADRDGQPARLLSGGEQQRLALARALATEPDVLFLDEPTASLDPASTQTIERIVREASGAGTKIVFVTHDIGQARRLASDVVFLHRGRLAEHAPAAAFFDAPRSSLASDYLAGELVL